MSQAFFRPRPASRPAIYAYEDTNPQYAGLLKIGYTTVDVQSRVARQYPTLRPGKPPYRIVLEKCAMRGDGTVFTDQAPLRTRFVRFLVSLRKATQHAGRGAYAFVPDIPLNRKWTDEKLYVRYGLTKAEIAFIESMVRPMGASDE